ncbi:type II secretion system F family protein, partial [Streptomyces beijiangensis]
GGEPAGAWGRFGAIPGAAALARCLERAGSTGAPAAGPVARVASGLRAEQDRAARARAQRASVLITAPVGLCFLPAFLAVGVAPVVIGLASHLLHGN